MATVEDPDGLRCCRSPLFGLIEVRAGCRRLGGPMDRSESITVVMPVFNGLPYLDAAVASIIGQTHEQLHLAIYDDGSTDGSYERAMEWQRRDQRISVVRGSRRLGPCASSQAAAELAEADFVARMDADDIAHPERLRTQLAALKSVNGAVLVGSTFEMIDRDGRVIRSAAPHRLGGPTPPFNHSSILYRRRAFVAAGGYRSGTDFFEDLDLYRRLSQQGQILVVNRPLLQLRFAGQNARLRDDQLSVLRSINRQHGDLPGGVEDPERFTPATFYSLAVLSVLGSQRPRLLRSMITRCTFRPRGQGALIAGYVALGELSPSLARQAGAWLSQLRSRNAERRFTPGEVYEWRFPVDRGVDG